MIYDLQKASMWKRIASGMFDGILTGILAVGVAFLLSLILNYDGYSRTLEEGYARYEREYGVTFNITQESYQTMPEEEQANYDAAYQALIRDEEVLYAYNMTVNLMLVITTVGVLLAMMVMEFAVPLFFGNGQTLGKKIFGLGLMRTDGVKLNNLQLFTRTLLGKFTIETMIPVNITIMIFLGIMDVTGTLVVTALLIAQVVILMVSRTNSLIHDLLAGTVVVDYSSQMIFRTTEDLIAYQKKAAAERAARERY